MYTWYSGVGSSIDTGVGGGGNGAITDFHETWNDLSSDTTLAELHAAAHGLLGATLMYAQSTNAPPACNSLAVIAWKNGVTELGQAATIEQNTTTLGPPVPEAVQDANDAFDQLGIVNTQGELALTAVRASASATAAS
ncbi:MAG TPA: hypothetical protein VK280_13985 [Streptosporangiaceae bacterium]|nr:hypothetical protein [Streptosporangiaceae bacterium]